MKGGIFYKNKIKGGFLYERSKTAKEAADILLSDSAYHNNGSQFHICPMVC